MQVQKTQAKKRPMRRLIGRNRLERETEIPLRDRPSHPISEGRTLLAYFNAYFTSLNTQTEPPCSR